MAFPTDRLTFKCELGLGFDPDVAFMNPLSWTDVTSYFLDQSVTISRGRANETDDTQVMNMGFELDNVSGWFTPDNPESLLYPYCRRGVLCRYGIYGGQSFLQLPDLGVGTDYFNCPDQAALDIVGDIDISFEVQPAAILAANTLVGKWRATGNQRSWMVIFQQDPAHPSSFRILFQWSTDGTAANTKAVATTYTFSYEEKMSIRIVLDVNNGAGGYTVNFYAANKWGEAWKLFKTTSAVGVTSIFNSTSGVSIGSDPEYAIYPFIGKIFRVQIRNGIAGTLVADADFTTRTPGATSFVDSVTRVWTRVGAAAITNLHTRFFGQIDSWEVIWPNGDVSGTQPPDCRVSLQASSLRRKIGQGEQPLQSALRRTLSSSLLIPAVQYWPMEDGSGTTKAASGLPNLSSANVNGFEFEAESGFAGSGPLPSIESVASFGASIPDYPAADFWTVGFMTQIPAAPAIDQELMRTRMTTASSVYRVTLGINATQILVKAYAVNGDEILSGTALHANAFVNKWGPWIMTVAKNGTGVDVSVYWREAGSAVYPIAFSWNIPASTMSNIKAVASVFGSQMGGTIFGHVSVVPGNLVDAYFGPDDGYAGESGTQRHRRLCDEEGVAFASGEIPNVGIEVGAQSMDTLLNLLQENADSTNSIFIDARFFSGLQYISLWDLQNQSVQLALDAALEHITNPLSPTLDDQLIRNQVESSRTDGGAYTFEDAQSIADEGLYADQVTVNLFTDDQLPDDAAWRVHLGTTGKLTYPPITIELAKASSLISAWLNEDTDVGSVITLANLPRQADSTLKRFILQGYTETMTPTRWTVVLNCTPYEPYEVTEFSGEFAVLRLDAELSTVDSVVTPLATSVIVNLNGGASWTTDPTDWPFDINIMGEFMRVTAVAAVVAGKQTLTVTRSINGVSKSHYAGEPVHVAYPVALALIGG